MSTTPNQKDLLAKKSDLEGILKPDANDILHLPDITISLAENQQGYTTSGLSKDGLVFSGAGTITGITSSDGNSTTLAASQSAVSAKQDKLTAGTNITIQNNVISATGGGSNVTVTPIQNEGKQVATISVDGTSSTLYSGKTVYTGTTTPSASLGANDDLYIKYGGEGTTSFEDLTLIANTANQVPITNFSNYLTISFRLTSTNWSSYADVEEDIADIPTYPSTITVFEYNVFNSVALSKYDNGIYIHLNGGMPNTVTQFVGTYTSYEPTNEYIKIENEWQEISIGGGGASALTNLTDVDITTPTDGQGLVYNNSTQKWENNNISVSSLSDINLTNLANGQILKYDSANQQWINANESGSGGGSFTETPLFTGGTSGTRTFTLSSAFTNYDYIAIYYSHNDGQTTYQDIRLYPSSLLYSLIGTSVNILGIANDAWYYYFTVTSTTQLDYAKSNAGWITDVIGIKYGGGGGSTTTVSVTPKVLTGINIADITVGNGNTTDIYDYAYFDGSGYYETPFKVDTDHEYEITFEANYDTTMAVIGTYAGANYFHLTIYNNYWYVGTNSGEVHPSAYTTGKHTFKTDSSHTYLDDTQFTSYTPAVVNNYITIGARENIYLYKGKFYEFKIKSISTGNVLYDLVPGMRGTTKGLYDLVSDTFVECSFITNMGTKTGTSGGVTTQLYAPSIEANPSGTATDSLSSIEIDGTIYNIEGGGGSGGNPELEETALLTTPITAEGTYTLLDNIEDYDFVSFVSGVSYEADIRLLAVSDMLNMLDNNLIINCAGTAGRWFNITALSGTSITITKYSGTIIQSIMGYKIKGGGGGVAAQELTTAQYEALTPAQKENGDIYFTRDTTPTVKNPTQLIERVSAANARITSSGHSAWGGEDWHAFDGISTSDMSSVSNAWCALEDDSTPWIQYHFDESYHLSKLEMKIYCHYNQYSTDKTVNMQILGSNDNSNWENILIEGTSINVTFPYRTYATVEYDLNGTNSYEYIRIQGTEKFEVAYDFGCDFDEIYVYGGTELETLNNKIYYMDNCYSDINSEPPDTLHHYSTSEQIVGTWIDGRDMYEKTYYNATGPSQNHPITLDSNITTSNTDYFVCPQYSYLVGGSYINGGSFLEVGLTSNGISANRNNAPSGLGTITELYTTVRYVKSQPRNVSLLHFEGDLTDECGIGWYIEGSPTISTEQSKFGSSSLKFSGGFLYSDITPVFKFGNNDFTIDAWLYPTRTDRQAFFAIAPYSGGDHRLGIDMWQQGNSANQWMSSNGSGWNITNADGGGNGIGSIALSTNTWQHIALVRHGTSFTLYINGQVAVTNNIGTASVYWGSSDVFKLGNWGNHRYPFYGYIDEFRVANYAVWTDTFTPPTQPYT